MRTYICNKCFKNNRDEKLRKNYCTLTDSMGLIAHKCPFMSFENPSWREVK